MKKIFFMLFAIIPFYATPGFAANTDLGIELYIHNNTAQSAEQGQASVSLCNQASGGDCYCSTATHPLENGLFSATLNCSTVDIATLPTTSFMQIEVDGELVASPEVQAVPYSLFSARAAEAETLSPGNVTINGNLIVTGNVTSPSLSGGTSSGDITAVLAGVGLLGGGSSGDITLSTVLGTSIESAEIVDGAITSAKIAPNSVGTNAIIDNSVTDLDLASDSVGNSELASNSVTGAKVSDKSLTGNDILSNSLDFDVLSDRLMLDNSTDIQLTNAHTFSLTNTGTGDSFIVRDENSDTTPFRVDNSGNLSLGGMVKYNVQEATLTGASTLTPTSSHIAVTCNTGPCPITLSEVGAETGHVINIINVSSASGVISFSVIPGIQDIAGFAGSFSVNPRGSASFIYINNQWNELQRNTP